MRIVLFYPRGKRHGSAGVGHLACVLPPLGLASIAAVLRKSGHDVSILDAALEHTVPNDQWAQRIAAARPDMVGFTANTPAFLDAYDVCRRVKDLLPSATTVFGGVHVSFGKGEILRTFCAIDHVVAGEGEFCMLRLAEGLQPSSIAGVHTRNGADVVSGPPQGRETFCEMDDLPFPAYDLLEGFPRRYRLPLFGYRRHPGAHIISSRGCVYQCSYCDRSVFGKSFRFNSPGYTFEQVKKLRTDFGVRHIYFYDDLFTLNRNRVAELCGKLRNARLGVFYNCIVRVGHIDEDLIGELKSSGCWMVNVGIESGDQKMLDENKDGVTLEGIRRDVTRLHDAGIWVKGLFMMGFPGETEESARTTIAFAASLPLKDANVTVFTPYPGAPIAERIREYGTFDEDWEKMDCEQVVFVPREIGSREKIEQLRAEFIRTFYRRPFMRSVYRRMMVESPHSYWRLLRNAGAFLRYAKRMGGGIEAAGEQGPEH